MMNKLRILKLLESVDIPEDVDHRFKSRTSNHIDLVHRNMRTLGKKWPGADRSEYPSRGSLHDKSKFESPEYPAYAWLQKWYDSDKDDSIYPEGIQAQVETAKEHHLSNNKHHPDYWSDVKDMEDIDLAEMVSDWAAMSEEKGDDVYKWMADNLPKHGFSEQQIKKIYDMMNILTNTRSELWPLTQPFLN